MVNSTQQVESSAKKPLQQTITTCITRHVDSNGYASEIPEIGLSSNRTSMQAKAEFAIESRLYPPSNAKTILP